MGNQFYKGRSNNHLTWVMVDATDFATPESAVSAATAIKIYGKGSLAISTAMEPLTLRVTPDFPLNVGSESLVAWTGDLIPTVLDDASLADVMTAAPSGFRIRFEGQGVVVAEEA